MPRPWLGSLRRPLTPKVKKAIKRRKEVLQIEMVKITVSERSQKRQVTLHCVQFVLSPCSSSVIMVC